MWKKNKKKKEISTKDLFTDDFKSLKQTVSMFQDCFLLDLLSLTKHN